MVTLTLVFVEGIVGRITAGRLTTEDHCRPLPLVFFENVLATLHWPAFRTTNIVSCVCCCVAHCKTAHVLRAPHLTMEVQEQESLGRWDGLGSRDAISRVEAMENIRQVVMTKVEAIRPIPSGGPSPPASGSPPSSDLNEILAHLLMLSRRCPFEDVRKSSSRLLQSVEVRVKTL